MKKYEGVVFWGLILSENVEKPDVLNSSEIFLIAWKTRIVLYQQLVTGVDDGKN